MNGELDFMFLAEGEQTFLMHSLKEILDRNGFDTDKCNMSANEIGHICRLPTLFITDAEILIRNSNARIMLYDKCIENNKKIILIGDRDTLRAVFDMTATNVIAQSFERPLNNNEIADRLGKLIKEIGDKGTKKRLLVVDDSPIFLRTISEWLEADYNINVCPSATAAFHLIEKGKPDLILLDYEMPICNGAQFLQMLHSEPSTENIPVMFLTSKDDAATVKSLISLKPQGYLLKSLSKEATLHAIADFFIRQSLQ